MTKHKNINTQNAPAAIGPYSQGVLAGDILFTSGQLGIDPSTGKLAGEDIETQSRQALLNLAEIIIASGGTKESIIKTSIFITEMTAFQKVNQIYSDFFEGHRPARSVVGAAALPLGAKIEIEAIAVIQ